MPTPRFYADLHIHSKYSRACSRDCNLENLAWWAQRKGVTLVGTGDFTHPAWFDHLKQTLVPAEPGLYRLNDELNRDIERRTPPECRAPVRFMLSVEISTIYKQGDKTRKVHHLVYLPDLEAVARFNRVLAGIGNIASDGRPILGLNSRDLLEITLEASPDGYLIPAHIWTPWFAALGSKSGFDAIADCYGDLADHVFAVETGLSSDPAMNWRVSSLDRYTLVSNSDAHSPPALAREATTFATELDYFRIADALRRNDGSVGTVEFFPEEGKYHLDGHRACRTRLSPGETKHGGGLCPVCGKPVTVGVLHRIDDLADRPEGVRPARAGQFTNLIPLPEIIGEVVGKGPKTKTVTREIDRLVAALGPELGLLTEVPVDRIAKVGGEVAGEAISRLRRGEVIRQSGYDGEYGVIRLFEPNELAAGALFDVPEIAETKTAGTAQAPTFANLGEVGKGSEGDKRPRSLPTSPKLADEAHPVIDNVSHVAKDQLVAESGLDPEQLAAVESEAKQLVIVAGPGTGKTRTLTHRIAQLVQYRSVPPEEVVAVTFTRRAAQEMAERLGLLLGDAAERITVATFHALSLRIVSEQHERLGLAADARVADEAERLAALITVLGDEKAARRAARGTPPGEEYLTELHRRGLLDVAELVELAGRLLEEYPEVRAEYRRRFRWLFVDEYQDIDPMQYRLLRALAPADTGLCVIGDPDQSIYRFRGAEVGFFLRFTTDYPNAQSYTLSRNYRSVASVVSLAGAVVRPASLVPEREFVATQDAGVRPSLYRAEHAASEATEVARVIDELVGGSSFHSLDTGRVEATARGHRIGFGDIAVLYRTDAQSIPLIAALDRAGVPYQKRGHDPLAKRAGVPELIHELRYANSSAPTDDGADTKLDDRLDRAARVLAPTQPAVWQARELLRPLAERCADTESFCSQVLLGTEVDALDPRADTVSLLTLHAAKGLEFPVVFLIGCDDRTLPLRFGGAEDRDEEEIREERRLLFVGVTRARERLFLSHPRQRNRGEAALEVRISPFLAGLGAEYLDVGETASRQRSSPAARQLRLL